MQEDDKKSGAAESMMSRKMAQNGVRQSAASPANFTQRLIRQRMWHLRVSLNHPIAFAGAAFQRGAIQNFHRAAAILNDVHFLKISRGLRNAGPVRAEHRR